MNGIAIGDFFCAGKIYKPNDPVIGLTYEQIRGVEHLIYAMSPIEEEADPIPDVSYAEQIIEMPPSAITEETQAKTIKATKK